MPKTLPAKCDYSRIDIPCVPDRPEAHPLVIRELESVNPSPQTQRNYLPWIADNTWRRLTELFTPRAGNDRERAEQKKTREIRSLQREMEAARREQEQKEQRARCCSRTGMALAAVTAAAAAGMLAYGLTRREENALSPAAGKDLLKEGFPQPDWLPAAAKDLLKESFPQPVWLPAAALSDYRQNRPALLQESGLQPLINTTRNALLSRFPGMGQNEVAQLMVTPLLKMLDESLPQPLTADALALRQQQLALMIEVLLPTLSIPEHLRLYQITQDSAELSPRFLARNGYAWITVDQQEYLLSTMPDGAPFIIDPDGRCRFVRFNQKTTRWEFVSEADNQGYTADNIKLLEEYSLASVDPNALKAMKYNEELNMLEAKSSGASHRRGVFARGKFIPTVWFPTPTKKSDKPAQPAKAAEPAACKEPTSAKLIAKSDYGWQVEPASVWMDDYLRIVLEDKDRCVKNLPVRPLELIDPANGLSDDSAGKTFLKKNYRYFNVERSAGNTPHEKNLTLPDFSNASVVWKNGVMLLKQSDNVIQVLKNNKIKNTIVSTVPFYMETDTVNYLRENALTLPDTPSYPLYWRHPGLWQGKTGAMLIVHDNKFSVREYTDSSIHVKSKKYPNDYDHDIELWACGNTLLRVREGKTSILYTPLQSVDNLRTLKIETELLKQLNNYIQENLISEIHPEPEDLMEIDGFGLPVAWLNTKTLQRLFYFHREYFLANFIDASNTNNPSGLNSIRVYGKGDFYTARKPIATLVPENKMGAVEMKTWESYLIEKLKIKKEVAALYLQKFPWRHIANIHPVEEAVNEVLARGQHYVAPAEEPAAKPYKPLDAGAQRRQVREKLYPVRVKPNQLKLLKLTANDKKVNARKEQLQNNIKELTQFIKNDIFPALESSLYYNAANWPQIKTYLSAALGVESDEFQSAFAATWRNNLKKIDNHLAIDNIYLVHGKDVKLKEAEKNTGDRIFMSPDNGNIYINTHKLNEDNNEKIQLAAELIQAVAYQQGINGDVLDFGPVKNMRVPVHDAGELLTERLKWRKLTQQQWLHLKEASKKYLSQVPAYKHKVNALMRPEKLAYLAQFDPAYRGHLYLNFAPFLTLLSLDAFYQLASNNKLATNPDTWVKQYCALRASCPLPPIEPPPAFTPTSSKQNRTAIPAPSLPHPRAKNPAGQDTGGDASNVQESAEDPDETSRQETVDTPARESVEDTDDTAQESVEDTDDTPQESDDSSDNISLWDSEEETDDSALSESEETAEDVSEEDTDDASVEDTDSDPDTRPREELGEDPPSAPESPDQSRPPAPGAPPVPPVPPVPPAVPPVPPVPGAPPASGGPGLPPPVEKAAQAAGAGALAGAGAGVGSGAPGAPANSTEATSSVQPETHPHKKNDQFFRHPQINIKNTHGRYIPAPEDDVFLPTNNNQGEKKIIVKDEFSLGWRHPLMVNYQGRKLGENEEIVYVEGRGNVIRVEIKELACLGEKDLTVAHMLRIIGEALVSPVVTNAIAWQEHYEMEIKGGQCPTPEDVYWLADRAEAFDAIINTVLGLVPAFWPAFALKNLLGPTLILIADAMEGKSISVGDVLSVALNAIMQAFAIFRTEIPMLNGVQRTKFISKPETANPGKSPFPFASRFAFREDGKPYIKIEEKEYLLETTEDAKSIVQDDNGRYRQVKFNQVQNRWDMILDASRNNDEVTTKQSRYRYSLKDLPREAVAEAGSKDSVVITIPGKPAITGVFIGMDFIPARLENIDGQTVAHTTLESVPHEEQRVLVWSPYGWEFERSSVKMDSHLETLLANKDDTSFTLGQQRFSAIRDADGLSYDYWGNAYLKKDYLYYKVTKKGSAQTGYELTLPDYSDAQIKFNNGYFTLESSDDMLFTFKTLDVKNKDQSFRIESAALDYLRNFAVKVTNPAGTSASSLFPVNDENFLVTSRTDKQIYFTPKPQYGSTPIKLWSDNKTWFRIREVERGQSPVDYINLRQCRVTRSPGGGSSCMAQGLFIDSELNQQLHRAIREEMTSDTLPALSKLTPVRNSDIPNLYQDRQTNRQFLNFAGNYFNAKTIAKTNREENPTGYPCVKVSGRSDFFSREKELATVVVIKDGDTVKLVDLHAFLAEKLNITLEQARLFLKNRAFIEMEHADEVESLTSHVQLSENIFVEQPVDIAVSPQTRPSDSALLEAAKKALFPDNILRSSDYIIEVHDLHNSRGRYSPTLQQARMHVAGQLDYLKNTMLVSVIKSLNPQDYNNPIIEDYLTEILENSDKNFLNEVQSALYSRLLSAKDEITRRNIKLITASKINPQKSAKYVNKIDSPVYIGAGNDDMLFINIDKLGLDEQSKTVPSRELTGAILDAVMLSTGKTSDLVNVPLKDGTYINIKDAYLHLQKALEKGEISGPQTANLHNVISRYLSKTPVYNARMEILNDMPSNWLKFNYMFRNDAGFRAHVSLNSHDLVTLITQDLHYRIAAYHQDVFVLHPWVKNHGTIRGVTTFYSGSENYTDELTPVLLEVSFLNRIKFAADEITEVADHKNIFRTADDNLYLKWQNNYYPMTFLGNNNRIVELGTPAEIRQVYYYHPVSGNISVIPHTTDYSCMMKYHRELDLYERSSVEAGYSEVFRFDPYEERLVSTGATKIVQMPGKVTRIEFPQFSIYHPHGATADLYLQGHGKTTQLRNRIPDNIAVQYYIDYGHQLVPYKGSTVDLFTGRFPAKEIKSPGETTEKYTIGTFTGMPTNAYHLARKYNKNMIHMLAPTLDSEALMTSVSKLYADKQVNLHLYMCRKIERGMGTVLNPPSLPGAGAGTSAVLAAAEETIHYNSGLAIGRWGFDQEFIADITPGGKGFAPLKEGQVYLRPHTVDALVTHSLAGIFKEHQHETWYGFETGEIAKMQIPPYVMETRIQLRNAMGRVRTTLNNALIRLNDAEMQEKIDDYISLAFDTLDPTIIYQVKERLKLCSSRIQGYIEESQDIDYKNIAIASTVRTEDPHAPGHYPTKLSNDAGSIMAFVLSGDALRRMFIIDDFFPKIKSSSPHPVAIERTQEHYIIHESSHTAANTVDVFYTLDMNFREMDVQGGLRNLNALLNSGKIKRTPLWRNTIPAILKHLNMPPLEESAAIKFIKDNPMVKANVMIENADSVTRYILDIAKLSKESRVRRQTEEELNDLDYKLMVLAYYASAEHHA